MAFWRFQKLLALPEQLSGVKRRTGRFAGGQKVGGSRMEKAKVYFTDFHTSGGVTLPEKLRKLVKRAGIDQLDYKDRYTAIKLHFGEPGNLAYLRPNYARVIVDIVKENGERCS